MLSKTFRQHPLRILYRGIWAIFQLLFAALDYVVTTAGRAQATQIPLRAKWLQRSSRRILRICDARWTVSGPIPHTGLLVTNHLSYVDILLIAAVTPCAFVAKREVKSWPVFGWFARLCGTIFVDRQRRTGVADSNQQIKEALDQGVLLVLFPEGTSWDNSTVLPFKSSLLEPVAAAGQEVSAGYLAYSLPDGDVVQELYYWADMTLLPHLINLLGKRSFEASVTFSEVKHATSDRKLLAKQLHAEVVRLRGEKE